MGHNTSEIKGVDPHSEFAAINDIKEELASNALPFVDSKPMMTSNDKRSIENTTLQNDLLKFPVKIIEIGKETKKVASCTLEQALSPDDSIEETKTLADSTMSGVVIAESILSVDENSIYSDEGENYFDALEQIGQNVVAPAKAKTDHSESIKTESETLKPKEVVQCHSNKFEYQSNKLDMVTEKVEGQSQSMLWYMVRAYASMQGDTHEAMDLAAAIKELSKGYVIGPYSEEIDSDKNSMIPPSCKNSLQEVNSLQSYNKTASAMIVRDVAIVGHDVFQDSDGKHVKYIIKSRLIAQNPNSIVGGDNCWLTDASEFGNDASILRNGRLCPVDVASGGRIEKSYTVHRRYNDFKKLHQSLLHRYPRSSIPVLPSSTLRRHFSTNHIERRERDLEKYLLKLIDFQPLHRFVL